MHKYSLLESPVSIGETIQFKGNLSSDFLKKMIYSQLSKVSNDIVIIQLWIVHEEFSQSKLGYLILDSAHVDVDNKT